MNMALDALVENILLHANMLVETAMKQEQVASMGKLYNEICKYYRALGICGLLLNADTDVFAHGLIHSALTRKYYLDRCIEENYLLDPSRRTSFVDPFFDALSANQFKLSRQIASVSPNQLFNEYEYEDDFLYALFMHKIVGFEEGNKEELRKILHQYEEVIEDGSSIRIELCKALFANDQNAFERTFADLLNEHQTKTDAIADPQLDSILAQDYTFEPNRWIFVEGLAILRIAEKLNLQTEKEYKFCPSIARVTDFEPFVPESFPYLKLETE